MQAEQDEHVGKGMQLLTLQSSSLTTTDEQLCSCQHFVFKKMSTKTM